MRRSSESGMVPLDSAMDSFIDNPSLGNDSNNSLIDYDLSLGENNKNHCVTSFQTSWEKIKSKITNFWKPEKKYYPRTIHLDGIVAFIESLEKNLPKNIVSNTKHTPITFLPTVLFEQFKYFFNLYFLMVAISQFIPALKVGYLFTFFAPLVFVLSITISKEAFDDFQRWKRDKEANSQIYMRLNSHGEFDSIPSSDIQVGDLIKLYTDQRAPADLLLLHTTEKSGVSFIRTDQLDGETDWKLRKAVSITQALPNDQFLVNFQSTISVESPRKEIYQFVGNYTAKVGTRSMSESISIENTIWANTVVASGTIIGLVLYTGVETRSMMNNNQARTKIGKLDLELNFLFKVLFIILILLAIVLEALNHFSGPWLIFFLRFILLFSSIIPISIRVNLDMGKIIYSFFIMTDKRIEGTIVRNSTIPEELGRISYFMTDKTGTLTQNDMVFKRLHLGTISYSQDTIEDIYEQLVLSYSGYADDSARKVKNMNKVKVAITALALCHNVTPVTDYFGNLSYQAASPDEVALVKFSGSVGMTLFTRNLFSIVLKNPNGNLEEYEILNIFPFTSLTKRMGIILKDKQTNQIYFLMKGADSVMSTIVEANDWLDEECGNMSREGLRTLVFGMKTISDSEYSQWNEHYLEAKSSIYNREENVQKVIEILECKLKLLCLTGVEDRLQFNVMATLEGLRNAGIKTWMLTGDKVETATCIAISARLISKNQQIYQMVSKSSAEALNHLNVFGTKKNTALVIDGNSLQLCLENCVDLFVDVTKKAPAVVCCRCSPTQKAEVVKLIKKNTDSRVCAIGDGGNDVSMIQAADVGLGIVGKEGKQASLAADFSLTQFSHVSGLLLWHGRNAYKRSSRLSQFVIHRGLVISFIQAIFSAIFYFAPIPIYSGWLIVGYSTLFTMFPVFCLVLDDDITWEIAFQFPELYQDLQKGRCLNLKTFLIWVFISVYQGGMIMLLAVLLFDSSLYSIVSITYTTLIFAQLLNVAFEIHKLHWLMTLSEIFSLSIYIASLFVLKGYFDIAFIMSGTFIWKTALITMITTIPIYLIRFIIRKCSPPAYSKLY